MSLRVRTSESVFDDWRAIPGDRDWVDYTHDHADADLVVYIHGFRRVRERTDLAQDRLIWKHRTTQVARRYRHGEWLEVVDARPEPPPTEVQWAPRPPRHPDLHQS